MITDRRIRIARICRCRVCGDAFRDHLAGDCEFEVSLIEDNGTSVIAALDEIRPEMAVLDVEIHRGFDLAEALRRRFPALKLVFVLVTPSDICIKQALSLRADGILSAQEPGEALAEHIRQIAACQRRFSPQIIDRIVCERPQDGYRLKNNTPIDSLSPVQLDILRHLARGDSLKMVASKLNLSRKSVDGHKYRIMKKIGVQDRVLLSRFAIREGLIEP